MTPSSKPSRNSIRIAPSNDYLVASYSKIPEPSRALQSRDNASLSCTRSSKKSLKTVLTCRSYETLTTLRTILKLRKNSNAAIQSALSTTATLLMSGKKRTCDPTHQTWSHRDKISASATSRFAAIMHPRVTLPTGFKRGSTSTTW